MRRGLAFLCLAVAACAQSVQTEPTLMKTVPTDRQRVVTVRSLMQLQLPTGYSRTLATGSRWRRVGTVPQGDVYRPLDGVFTVEGRQVHEAYLVVVDTSLKGFYLPGESSYAPLPSPVQISWGESP